jgi:mono/diheme cytochrome c family protein
MSSETIAAFNNIVLDGLLSAKGMASFADVLNAEQSTDVLSYVKARAEEDRRVAAGEKEIPQMTWQTASGG